MGGVRFDEREHRHYRGRFPLVGILDQRARDGAADPWLRGAPTGGQDLAVLTGYGRHARGLALALADTGMQVLVFESHARAAEQMHRLRPELILAGEDPTAGDVFGFLSVADRVDWATVVVLLADRADPDLVARALEHGAHDVVCPPHSVTSITTRLQVARGRVRDGRTPVRDGPHRLSLGRLSLDLTTRQVLGRDGRFSLSGREFELLVRLVEAGGNVVSREDLLQDIWGSDQGSAGVLDATVHRLRKRLDGQLRDGDLVTTVRGVGYRLDPGSLDTERVAAD